MNNICIEDYINLLDGSIDDIVNIINNNGNSNDYYNAQLAINDSNNYNDFLKYCHNLSSISHIDELGGYPDKNSIKKEYIRRYPSTKYTFDDILKYSKKSLGCGIKVVPCPTIKFTNYELWEDGYIELFTRICINDGQIDLFLFDYIKMKHLKDILIKFKDNLFILKI